MLIRNIGTLLSGDTRQRRLDADSIVIRDGKIAGVGRRLDEDTDIVVAAADLVKSQGPGAAAH